MTRCGRLGVVASLALVACGEPGTGPGQDDEDAIVYPATVSSRDFGDYELHFNAITTDQLDAGIARNYDIVRSNKRVLLTVSVLRKQGIGLPTPVAGAVTASARNLTGQLRNLRMSKIEEEESVYYVADMPVVNSETLIFTVEAVPESTTTPLKVQFQKQFFVDE